MENKTKRIIHITLLCGIILQSCMLPQSASALDAGGIAEKAIKATSWIGTSWQASPFWFSAKALTAGTLAYMLWKERKTMLQTYYWCKTRNSRATNIAFAGLATAGSLFMFMKLFAPYMKNQRALGYAIDLMTPVLTGLTMAMAGQEDGDKTGITDAKGDVHRALASEYKGADPETLLGRGAKYGANKLINFLSEGTEQIDHEKVPTLDELRAMNPECINYIEKISAGIGKDNICPLLQIGETGSGKSVFVTHLFRCLREHCGQNIALVSLNIGGLANTEGLKGIGAKKVGDLLRGALQDYVRCGYLPKGSIVFFDEADTVIALHDNTAHGEKGPNLDAGNNNEMNKEMMKDIEKTTVDLGLRLIAATNLTESEITRTIARRFTQELQIGDISTKEGDIIHKRIPNEKTRRAIFKFIFESNPQLVNDIEKNNEPLLKMLIEVTDNFSTGNIKLLCTKLMSKWTVWKKMKREAQGETGYEACIPFGMKNFNGKNYEGDYEIVLKESLPEMMDTARGDLVKKRDKCCDIIKQSKEFTEKFPRDKNEEQRVLEDLLARQNSEVRDLQSRIDKLEQAAYHLSLKAEQAQLNQEIALIQTTKSFRVGKTTLGRGSKRQAQNNFLRP